LAAGGAGGGSAPSQGIDNLQAKVDALKRLQAETAAELDAMPPSILDQAFKGEL
jgi:type I restriction enzyme S subunit